MPAKSLVEVNTAFYKAHSGMWLAQGGVRYHFDKGLLGTGAPLCITLPRQDGLRRVRAWPVNPPLSEVTINGQIVTGWKDKGAWWEAPISDAQFNLIVGLS